MKAKGFRRVLSWTIIALIASLIVILALPVTAAPPVPPPSPPPSASGSPNPIDLTSPDSTATVNGAIFASYTPRDPTGSGVFKSFLRVGDGSGPCIAGYNTDAKGKSLEWDTKGGVHTHAIQLGDIPKVQIDSVMYREFQLDINQNAGLPSGYLSIDELEFWMTEQAKLTGYPFNGNADKVWELDNDPDNVDNYLWLNYNLDNGSGKRDLKAWIPNSVFDGYDETDYLVLFAQHGMDPDGVYQNTGGAYPNNDGYEEWGVVISKVFPDTLVNIDASEVYFTPCGCQPLVDLYVSEANTGNDPISNASVTVSDGSGFIVVLDKNTLGMTGDNDNDGVLDIGETWNWTITSIPIDWETAYNFTATGTGTDSAGDIVTWPDYPGEQDSVYVYVPW